MRKTISFFTKCPRLGLLFLFLYSLTTYSRAQSVDSLDLKIGQMILIGFADAQVDPKVLEEIQKGKVGSILIFEKNIPKSNSFIALKKIIWTFQQAATIPLFVTIDQEGGRVNRLKDKYGFPRSITAEAIGKSRSLDSVRFYSETTAATLAGLGINLNFSPVVDLAVDPANPVIVKAGRSFSANADSVALLAKIVIEAHHRANVLTALKHFPGHGSSKSDTHFGITDVTSTWSARELIPYKKLIDSGMVDAVMSAHIVNKKLDPSGNPGTLSRPILTGMLREQLNFNGVIFSDDMQMHAITKYYGLEQAIKFAIEAGVDIMVFSNNIMGSEVRTVDKVHEVIHGLVKKGELSEQRIDQSFRRIMTLKRKLTLSASTERNNEEQEEEIALQKSQLEKLQRDYQELQEKYEKTLTKGRKKKRR